MAMRTNHKPGLFSYGAHTDTAFNKLLKAVQNDSKMLVQATHLGTAPVQLGYDRATKDLYCLLNFSQNLWEMACLHKHSLLSYANKLFICKCRSIKAARYRLRVV